MLRNRLCPDDDLKLEVCEFSLVRHLRGAAKQVLTVNILAACGSVTSPKAHASLAGSKLHSQWPKRRCRPVPGALVLPCERPPLQFIQNWSNSMMC
jgi:hypothetical protein